MTLLPTSLPNFMEKPFYYIKLSLKITLVLTPFAHYKEPALLLQACLTLEARSFFLALFLLL